MVNRITRLFPNYVVNNLFNNLYFIKKIIFLREKVLNVNFCTKYKNKKKNVN